jgi:endoglucanase
MVIASSADESFILAYNEDADLIRFYSSGSGIPPTPTPVPTPTISPTPTPVPTPTPTPGDTVMFTSRSRDYVESMGMGWNLGNSLDAPGGTSLDNWETDWGNPRVTQEFIQSIADRGFTHIRIPFTIGTGNRFTDRGASTPANELRYVINPLWLNRYLEVVQWAHDAGLYVMVNIHHDSWMWIGRSAENWRGEANAWQVRRFRDHWTQLAQTFADFDDRVMFETLNEPHFYPDNDASVPQQNEMLAVLNRVAFDVIRATPGNETRIIVIPTIWTSYSSGHCRPVRDFIRTLHDENIVATVHYYSEWLFSANLGITSFDEPIGTSPSARVAADNFFDIIDHYFMSEGIGVTIGEWGLLAYDGGEDLLQRGEELKYYEYMQYKAREANGICLTFWDNGSGINRRSEDLGWRIPRMGEMLESSGRSSYSAGLDTVYVSGGAEADITIHLTLNGNEFLGIAGLARDTDYTYEASAVTLKKEYINERLNAINDEAYGIFDTLVMRFDGGLDWHQYLVKNGAPVFTEASGTRNTGITIPFGFKGNSVRRVGAFEGSAPDEINGLMNQGKRVGGNHTGWWPYLEYGGAYTVNYENETITLRSGFFTGSVREGANTLVVEFYDGSRVDVTLDVAGTAGGSAVAVK